MLYGTLFGIKDAKKLLISHKKLTTTVNLTYVKLTGFSLEKLRPHPKIFECSAGKWLELSLI